MVQQRLRVRSLFWQIIHADRDHAQRTLDQFARAAAPRAVTFHVFHAAVELPGQPRLQSLLGLREIDVTETYLLKAEISSPGSDVFG